MQKKRSGLFVTSYEGKLWAIGGEDVNNQLSSEELYDPKIDTWTEAKAPLKSIGKFFAGTAFSSKYFYQN